MANKNQFFKSSTLRSALIKTYRVYAMANVFGNGPRVFVNSIPKAGTHLLTTMLGAHPDMQHSRLHIERRAVNSLDPQRMHVKELRLNTDKFKKYVGSIRKGQYFTSHLDWSQEVDDILQEAGCKVLFVVRNPLDVVVSYYFYATGLERQFLHKRLTTEFKSKDDVIKVLINGAGGKPPIIGLKETLTNFSGWLASDSAQIVRFEDLVGAAGGGSEESKNKTIRDLMEYLELSGSVDQLSSYKRKSATFRSGKLNGWSEHISPENIDLVKNICADEIKLYGYSID